jgi:hypothetical protein
MDDGSRIGLWQIDNNLRRSCWGGAMQLAPCGIRTTERVIELSLYQQLPTDSPSQFLNGLGFELGQERDFGKSIIDPRRQPLFGKWD